MNCFDDETFNVPINNSTTLQLKVRYYLISRNLSCFSLAI